MPVPALRSLLDVAHQVVAEVGPVIISATIKRPHDLEALEYGEDIVVYLEALTRRLPSEISAMGTEPPVSPAVPLVPSKRLIDLEERLNRYLGGSRR